jgi:PAS domain S-box-containing protein
MVRAGENPERTLYTTRSRMNGQYDSEVIEHAMNASRSEKQLESNNTSREQPQVQRCAVCKIDLKGRFVYIDDETESLFGLTKEELFGQPLELFLAEEDRDVVNSILCERSRYETFYDAASIKLLRHNGEPFYASVIISLNFIAGNPVNFQFIINPGTPIGGSFAKDESQDRTFVDAISRACNPINWLGLRSSLQEYCRAQFVAVYRARRSGLELLPELSADQDPTVSEMSKIHETVAQSGEDYVFVSSRCVQQAVELDGQAPHEIIFRLDLREHGPTVFRLGFDQSISDDAATTAIHRAEFAARVVSGVMGLGPVETVKHDVPTDNLSINNALSQVSIGLMQTDGSGRVTAYNTAMGNHFSGRLPQDHAELIQILEETNQRVVVEEVQGYLTSSAVETLPRLLTRRIGLPGSASGVLVVVPGQVGGDSVQHTFLFLPDEVTDQTSVQRGMNGAALQQALMTLRANSEALLSIGEKLVHEHHAELGKNGNYHLQTLRERLARHDQIVKQLAMVAEVLVDSEATEIVDLAVILQDEERRLQEDDTIVRFHLTHSELPKITSYRRRVQAALRYLFDGCAGTIDESAQANVQAEIKDDLCELVVSIKGVNLHGKRARGLWDLSRRPNVDLHRPTASAINQFAVSKLVLNSIHGDIDIKASDRKTCSFTILIPTVGTNSGEDTE